MEVFRIVQDHFANKLSASGFANRWNRKEEWVLYASASRSLASLELLVHQGQSLPKPNARIVVISIPDDDLFITTIQTKQLPPHWRSVHAYADLQKIGSAWYQQQTSVLLKIPSVIVPNECNYVMNTQHPHFKKQIKYVRSEPYFWDERL